MDASRKRGHIANLIMAAQVSYIPSSNSTYDDLAVNIRWHDYPAKILGEAQISLTNLRPWRWHTNLKVELI